MSSIISSAPPSPLQHGSQIPVKKKSRFIEARKRLENRQNSFDEIMEDEYISENTPAPTESSQDLSKTQQSQQITSTINNNEPLPPPPPPIPTMVNVDKQSIVFKTKEELQKSKSINEDIVSFKNFTSTITNSYWGYKSQFSTSLDLLSVYIKGLKILYIESKTYCERYLNFLMLPAIFISALCTILSIALKDYLYGSIIVAILTGMNSFILAMISYLKLDAKAESFRVSAYKFDKLQTKCEFGSGKILLSTEFENNTVNEYVKTFINQLEEEIKEIKESNQFVIPETIRYRYPKLYFTNIFVEIKKRENMGKLFLHELNTVYNKLSILEQDEKPDKRVIDDLTLKKHTLIKKIIEHRDTFSDIDKELTDEINRYIDSQNGNCCKSICFWHNKKRKKNKNISNLNKCVCAKNNSGDDARSDSIYGATNDSGGNNDASNDYNEGKNKYFKWFVDHFWKNKNTNANSNGNSNNNSNNNGYCMNCRNGGGISGISSISNDEENKNMGILPITESNV